MANQQQTKNQQHGKPVMGSIPKGAKENLLTGGDAFSETVMFAPLADASKAGTFKHKKPWLAGEALIGKLIALRTANKNGPAKDQYEYACLETLDGEKFRVQSPGQLAYNLRENVKIGDVIIMTYTGLEKNDAYPDGVHNFIVSRYENVQ